jgi:hypothetical protein
LPEHSPKEVCVEIEEESSQPHFLEENDVDPLTDSNRPAFIRIPKGSF